MNSSIVVFARHGNTFAKGDRAVWVGRNEDLPLTEEGERQALQLARSLATLGLVPNRIFSAPLRRTTRFAELVQHDLGISGEITLDRRLLEIDYGLWAGKTNDEIESQFGCGVIRQWQEDREWPEDASWSPNEETVREETAAFLTSLQKLSSAAETILVVTSNGRLRFLYEVVASQAGVLPAEKGGKMRTGCAGIAEVENRAWRLLTWDSSPEELLTHASSGDLSSPRGVGGRCE